MTSFAAALTSGVLEARRELPDLLAITIRDLLRATLRHRPDRVVLGKVRGGEAFDLLQALNTGHAGTLSTIHANSAEQALARWRAAWSRAELTFRTRAVRQQLTRFSSCSTWNA